MTEIVPHTANQLNAQPRKSPEERAQNCLRSWMGWRVNEERLPAPCERVPSTCIAFNTALDEARAMLPTIRAAVEKAEADARPATAAEILTELELLESRYHRADHDAATAKALARQWVEDLQSLNLPIAMLRERCRKWRMSENAFAPRSAGQLLGGVTGEWMGSYALRARQALRRIENEEYAPVLSGEELDALAAAEQKERLEARLALEAERAQRLAQTNVREAEDRIAKAKRDLAEAASSIEGYEAIVADGRSEGMVKLAIASIKGQKRRVEDARENLAAGEADLAASTAALAEFDLREAA